jgi:hypothetical protein
MGQELQTGENVKAKLLIPEDGALKLALGYHSSLRNRAYDNPYAPGKPKFRMLDGSDLVWHYGFLLGEAEKKEKK